MAQVQTLRTCNICDQNKGVYYCYECEQGICKACRNMHDKVPLLRKHTLTDLQHVDRSIYNLRTSCKKHSKEYVLYCDNEDCKCLTCSVCITTEHKGHVLNNIETVAKNERDSLKLQKENLQSRILKISQSIDTIKTTKFTAIDAICTEHGQSVKEMSSELIEIITKESEKELIKGNDFNEIEKQQLQNTMEELEKIHTRYLNTLQRVDQILEEKHHTIFLNLSKSVDVEVKITDTIPEIAEPQKLDPFKKDEFITKIIQEIKSRHEIRVVKEKEDEIMELQRRLVLQETTIEDLQNEIKANKTKSKELENGIVKEKEDEIMELQRRLVTQETTIEDLQNEIKANKAESKELENRIIKEKGDEVMKLQRQLVTQESKITVLQKEIKDKKEGLKQFETSLIQKKEEENIKLLRKLLSEQNLTAKLQNEIKCLQEKNQQQSRLIYQNEKDKEIKQLNERRATVNNPTLAQIRAASLQGEKKDNIG